LNGFKKYKYIGVAKIETFIQVSNDSHAFVVLLLQADFEVQIFGGNGKHHLQYKYKFRPNNLGIFLVAGYVT
jgi:hypothetical protein